MGSIFNEIASKLARDRESRRQMTPLEAKIFDWKREAPLEAAERRTDPALVQRYLIEVAMRLQDGESLPYEVRRWLADALTEVAIAPTKAAAAFGLSARKGRPNADKEKVNAALRTVEEEKAKRTPLNDTAKGAGAFSIAGERHDLSPDLVAREWKHHQAFMRDWKAWKTQRQARGI